MLGGPAYTAGRAIGADVARPPQEIKAWSTGPRNTSPKHTIEGILTSLAHRYKSWFGAVFVIMSKKSSLEKDVIADIREGLDSIDKEKLKKKLDLSHFSANAVIRGMQLTLVGGRSNHTLCTKRNVH